MRTAIPLTVLATALACSLGTAPANARARVFVASYGNDANPCTFGSPCKTFQVAVNAVDAGGEVSAIDSAGFGPITITKAVTITSPDGVEAGIVPTSGGNAITINAGISDAIALRGLTLDGFGLVASGIVFNSGASLKITNCVAQNFVSDGVDITTGNGILIQPSTGTVGLVITNTIASDNGNGIAYIPRSGGTATINGILDHVVATGNRTHGIELDAALASGSAADIAISNSIASNNANGIIAFFGHSMTVSIDNVTMNGNSDAAIQAGQPAIVLLSRSVIQGNNFGTVNNTSNTFFTYGNNLIDFNGTNFSGGGGGLNTLTALR